MPTDSIGKLMITGGVVLIIAGLFLIYSGKWNYNLFNLPGDIVIKRDNFSFYFPIVSMIILSVILSAVFYIINKIW